MSPKTADVVVIGGGVVGSALAYFLARAGASVAVVDRDPPGGQAAMLVAGILAPAVEAGAPGPFCELGLSSYQMFPGLAREMSVDLGIEIDLQATGGLRIAWTEPGAAELRSSLAWERERGIDVTWLPGEDLRRLEPSLARGIVGGLYTSLMSHVNTARLVQGYLEGAARAGATIILGAAAHGLRRRGGRVVAVETARGPISAGQVVVSAGAWTGLYGTWLGTSTPIRPRKGQLMVVQPSPSATARLRHIIYDAHNYLVPKADGTIVVGATEEDVGFDRRVTLAGLEFLVRVGTRAVPVLRQAEYRQTFGGFRPMPIDTMPIIGRAPECDNLIFATGHYRNGILLGPITGRLVTQLAEGHPPEIALEPFSPARFAASV